MKMVETNYNINSNKNSNYILLADFHSEFPNSLAYEIKNSKCDYVIIAGDIFHLGSEWNNIKKVNKFKKFISIIAEDHPVIMTLGNHDLCRLSDQGFNNFKELKSIKNVYPLYNEQLILGDNRFTNILPDKKSFSYFKQEKQKIIELLIEEYSKFKIEPNSKYIEHLVAHNPQHFNHPELKDLISNYDIIETGHFHSGWIPSKYLLRNLDTRYDKSLRELFRNKVFRTKNDSLTVRPRRNLSHGMAYIYEDGYYLVLENKKIYFYNKEYNKYTLSNEKELSNRLKEERVPAIVITGAINTFMRLKMFYPYITKINLGDYLYGGEAIIKEIN